MYTVYTDAHKDHIIQIVNVSRHKISLTLFESNTKFKGITKMCIWIPFDTTIILQTLDLRRIIRRILQYSRVCSINE